MIRTTTKKAAAAPAPAAGDPKALRIPADPKKTREQMLAEVLLDPAVTSATTVAFLVRHLRRHAADRVRRHHA